MKRILLIIAMTAVSLMQAAQYSDKKIAAELIFKERIENIGKIRDEIKNLSTQKEKKQFYDSKFIPEANDLEQQIKNAVQDLTQRQIQNAPLDKFKKNPKQPKPSPQPKPKVGQSTPGSPQAQQPKPSIIKSLLGKNKMAVQPGTPSASQPSILSKIKNIFRSRPGVVTK